MSFDFENPDFADPYLRVFPNPRPLLDHEDVPFFGGLPELLKAIRELIGHDLLFARAGVRQPKPDVFHVPVRISEQKTIGHLLLDIPPVDQSIRPEGLEKAKNLVHALAEFLSDAYRWQYAVREQEERAAAPVSLPRSLRSEEKFRLSLREQLKAATQLLDCSAAALYVLEESTRLLKTRSVWGLPEERLLDEGRPLNRAAADLEALLGHALILNDAFSLESWGTPEYFPTCVCIPVMSECTIFGTAWFFAEEVRRFDSREMGYLEMVAARIATELERRAAVEEVFRLRQPQPTAG